MKNGCILNGDVGSGKSITALAFYYTYECQGMFASSHTDFKPMKNPMNLFIITTVKKRNGGEWEEECANFALGKEPDTNGVTVTIDSWNNIGKYTDVQNSYFIFDEQRAIGSGAWSDAFLTITRANRWIILSATPGDTWMDYCPVFLAHGFFRNRTEFVSKHAVFSRFAKYPKIERFVDTDILERYRSQILVDMPFTRHTTRHIENVHVEYDKELFQRVVKERWHVFEDRPLKDVGELFRVMRKVVNQDPSRLGATMKLIEKHPRLIIFYSFDYELDLLRTLGRTLNIVTAEWNGHYHEDVPDTDRWLYLVQYTAGSEGWNCITTDSIAFYSLTYSYKQFEQAQGRTDRLNTPYIDLYYYVYRSLSQIDLAIWKSLMGKKIFNVKKYATKVWGDDEESGPIIKI